MRRLALSLVATSILVLTGQMNDASSQITDLKNKKASVDKIFSNFSDARKRYEFQTPGCAVGIIYKGAFLYKKGYGMANLEQGRQITPRTVFRIASLSKQFTAFAIALLDLRGELSLNHDVRRYLPELTNL